MALFDVHADFACSIVEQVEADSEREALNELITSVYLKGLNPLVDLVYFQVTDEYGNTIKKYLYDRPRLGEALTTEDGRIIFLDQPKFKLEENE